MNSTLRSAVSYAGYPLLTAWPIVVPITALSVLPAAATPLWAQAQEVALFLFIALPVVLAVSLLEKRMPAQPEQRASAVDLRTDWIHMAMCFLLVAPFAQGLVRFLLVGAAGSLSAQAGSQLWPSSWPLVIQFLLALLIAEFGQYWFHRLAHLTTLGWRFHATHHGAHQVYWLNSTRFHAFELVVRTFFQVGPLVLLGCTKETFLVFGLFTIIHGWVQHANVVFHTGFLDYLMATPKNHRWHHSTNLTEANTNFGVTTALWDHLFGTFFSPRDRVFTGAVGIAELPDFPTGYFGQFLSAFSWKRMLQRQPSLSPAQSGDGHPRGTG